MKIIVAKILQTHKNGRNIIVLTDRIKQLDIIFVKLSNSGVSSDDIGYYIGTTPTNERARSSNCSIILSTYGMAKEGLDIPRLDCLVLATPRR